jgi:hypothetical protein
MLLWYSTSREVKGIRKRALQLLDEQGSWLPQKAVGEGPVRCEEGSQLIGRESKLPMECTSRANCLLHLID